MRPPANPAFRPMRSKKSRRDTITPARHSWLTVDKRTLIMYVGPSEYGDGLPPESRQSKDYRQEVNTEEDRIVLVIESMKGANLYLALENFTANELQAMRTFIDGAFARAIPVAKVRDRIAEELYNELGDDTDTRLYRAVPRLSYRRGALNEHDQSVPERPSESPSVPQLPTPPSFGPRSPDLLVVERNEIGGGTEDDAAPGGEREGVRQVGEDGEGLPF